MSAAVWCSASLFSTWVGNPTFTRFGRRVRSRMPSISETCIVLERDINN